ncbi:MAG: hypothetical protein K2O14_08780 [Oscillospiraceae bacterium]|nr:hypothetical protein [Oscillospiraceae bacterium]
MNEMITTDMDLEERAALLNSRINANAQLVAEGFVVLGRDLKAMRDEKLYTRFACETFDEYCEKLTPIRQRQAYSYIRCFEKYGERLGELSHIGVTKLALMTVLEDEDRERLIESGEAEELSARELVERVKALQSVNEQLTLELEERSKEESAAESLKKQNEQLSAEIEALKSVQNKQKERVESLEKLNKELSSRPVEVAIEKPSAEEIAKIKKAAAQKAEKAAKKQYDAKLKEMQEKADSARNAAYEEARKANVEELEKLRAENAALQSNAKKTPPDSKKERLKFYLEECQRSFNSALEAISAFEDGGQRQKMRSALTKTLKAMSDTLLGTCDGSEQQ